MNREKSKDEIIEIYSSACINEYIDSSSRM